MSFDFFFLNCFGCNGIGILLVSVMLGGFVFLEGVGCCNKVFRIGFWDIFEGESIRLEFMGNWCLLVIYEDGWWFCDW